MMHTLPAKEKIMRYALDTAVSSCLCCNDD